MLTADLLDAHFASDTPSVADHTLKTGTFTLRTLPVEIGELNETMSLASKRRLHNSEDGRELMFETVNTIPFGAEPQIQRKIKISDGLLCATMDMIMRPSCPLTELSAGGLAISGSIRVFGWILPPEKGCFPCAPEMRNFAEIPEGGVIYDAPFPPLGLRIESDEERFDWMTGDDFWRWTNADRIGGGKARFIITKEHNAIRMQWKLFEKLPVKKEDDAPIPGRNWRLTWAAAWKPLSARSRKKKASAVFDLPDFDFPGSARAVFSMKKNAAKERGCCCASATLNVLKKWIRSQLGQIQEGALLEIRNVQPVYCVNAGHVDRAKYNSLPHWDLMSLIEFRRWANRTLAAKNASLRILAPEKSPWRSFMILD